MLCESAGLVMNHGVLAIVQAGDAAREAELRRSPVSGLLVVTGDAGLAGHVLLVGEEGRGGR